MNNALEKLINFFEANNHILESRTLGDRIIIRNDYDKKITIGLENADYSLLEYYDEDSDDNITNCIFNLFKDVLKYEKNIEVIDNIDEISYEIKNNSCVDNECDTFCLTSEYSDRILKEDFAITEFDGTSYYFHYQVLEIFWSFEFKEFKETVNELARGLVDVYTYKGKQWWIVPRIDEIEIIFPDSIYNEIYYIIDTSKPVKQVAENVKQFLEETKNDLLKRSFNLAIFELLEHSKPEIIEKYSFAVNDVYELLDDKYDMFYNDKNIEGAFEYIIKQLK